MTRKISIIGADGAATVAALAAMDIAELALIAPGAGATADAAAAAVGRDGARRRVCGSEDPADASGATVLVLAAELSAERLRDLCCRTPDAIVVVAAGAVEQECARVLAATALPPPRVVGVAPGGPEAAELAAAVVLDRGHVVDCVACDRGAQGGRPVRARVGAGGVSEIAAEV